MKNLQEHIRKVLNKIKNEKKNWYNFIKTTSFEELPYEYKKSLIIYMYEGDVVDWSIDLDRDVVSQNDKLIKTLINDYESTGRLRHKSFGYGVVPMKILTDEITDRLGYDSFEEYHKDYGDNTDHGSSVLPVILSFDNDELIEDGWHRFHSYYRKGLKNIPVVVFM